MATIYETIKYWANGQNGLNGAEPDRGQYLQMIVSQVVSRLQSYPSLADLAMAYYADQSWWPFIAREFDLENPDADMVRNAAYWQRFMQLRHPAPSKASKRS